MDILFLGYTVPKERAHQLSGASVAGNKMQWNVVKHLSKEQNVNLECVTVLPLAAWPRDRMYSSAKRIELDESLSTVAVAFCNLPVIKQLWQICSVYHKAKRYVKAHPNGIVMGFNLFPQIGIPIRLLKRQHPKIKTVALLADLPIDDTSAGRSKISAVLRKWFDSSTWKSISACESFIVLNQHVAQQYFPEKKSITVEGGVDEDDLMLLQPIKKIAMKKNILFAGALTEYNGIYSLIDAMKVITADDVVLDIYGVGPLESFVKESVITNPRIHFHGRVSNDEVMKAQREAWLLINPRKTDNMISRVTFPSKTFEYLLSGTPVLSTYLNGYTSDYLNHMIIAADDSGTGLAKAIDKVSTIEPEVLHKIGEQAQQFIREEKRWSIQVHKIYRFLCDLE